MAQSTPPPLKVHELDSVAPPEGTTAATSLPLTFFDVLWLRLPPVERLFFYEFPNPTTTSFFDSVLPNLKHSLSLTLQHFTPLAGKITWPHDSPNPIINYVPGVDAVPLTIAEYSNANNFNHLCSNLCEAVERRPLIPHLNISHEKASVLALQVTVFPNLGFCIGITTHHAAVDGRSSTLFLKAWAYLCSNLGLETKSSLHKDLTPFYDRSVIRDPRGINEACVDVWLKIGGPNNRSLKLWDSVVTMKNDQVKGSFEFTPSNIQKLKQHAQSKLKTTKVSTFSVTCGFLLACLVKVEKPENKRVAFLFNVDCRSRLDPPLPPTYFGSCVVSRIVVVETNKLLENDDGFISGVEAITEVVNKLEDGEGVLDEAEKWLSKAQSVMGDRRFTTAGSPRFEVYGIDFGWGRPKMVDVTSIDRTGAFSLSESKDRNGGVEIGLALNKSEMEVFAALFYQQLESF